MANTTAYKIRFNPDATGKQINEILDALDASKGFCPCQPRAANMKCHCFDFRVNKAIGEPCICGIYVKVAK